jgi:dephospho-CoA kinase
MIVLGLTGSIGMGKSATARMFAEEGAPVNDADAEVHALYAPGGEAVGPIGQAFADVIHDGAVDRAKLSRRIAGDPDALARLEAIVHPLVAQRREAFLAKARADGARVVVLDVPLLFEVGQDRAVDAVVVVSSSPEIQRERVLARPGMTPRKLEEILRRQIPDDEKRARADFVVDTGQGFDHARDQVRRILETVSDPSYRAKRKLAAPPEPSH